MSPQISPFNFGEEEFNFDESVTAVCSVSKGDLPLSIFWKFHNEHFPEYNLTSNDGVLITKNNAKVSVLTIEAVKARHRGNYTCFASNRAGIAHHSAFLSINGNSSFPIEWNEHILRILITCKSLSI